MGAVESFVGGLCRGVGKVVRGVARAAPIIAGGMFGGPAGAALMAGALTMSRGGNIGQALASGAIGGLTFGAVPAVAGTIRGFVPSFLASHASTIANVSANALAGVVVDRIINPDIKMPKIPQDDYRYDQNLNVQSLFQQSVRSAHEQFAKLRLHNSPNRTQMPTYIPPSAYKQMTNYFTPLRLVLTERRRRKQSKLTKRRFGIDGLRQAEREDLDRAQYGPKSRYNRILV